MPALEKAGAGAAVRAMASRWRGRPLALIGFSLGGSRTLHLVGRRAEGRLLARAVAVSAPLDLARCVDVLDGARPPLYTRYLLRGLKRQLRLRRDLAALVDVERALAAPSIRAFDDALIAPLHGFASAEDYYARCSAGPVLPDVAVPTLAIRAEDDPFLAREDLAHFDAASAQVEIVRTPRGGHVGFLDARLRPWSLMRAAEWVVGGAGAG